MAKEIKGLDGLRDYLDGVIERAQHHARGIVEVIAKLSAAVVVHHDKGSLVCRTYGNKTTNILWFS